MSSSQERRQVSTITASHNVRLTKGIRMIFSEQAVYFRKEEKMVFTGDPIVKEGDDEVRGERITVYLKDDRALVEGGKAVIYPK